MSIVDQVDKVSDQYKARFTLAGPVMSLAGNLARRVVLGLGKSHFRPTVVHRCQTLSKLWRKRLYRWRKPALTARFWSAYNCPPVGMHYRPSGRYCHLDWLCPFCWGRNAQEVFNAFKAQLNTEYAGTQFVTAYKSQAVYELSTSKDTQCVVRRARSFQKRLVAIVRASSAYVTVTLEPSDKGRWLLTNRGILITEEAVTQEVIATVSALPHRIRQIQGPTKTALSRLVGWALLYPLKLLTGNPRRVLTFIRAHKGLRMSARYGDLRRYLRAV